MAIKFDLIKPGDELFSRRAKGAVFPVRIVSIDRDGRTVTASINNNPARTYSKRNAERWSRKKPT